MPPVEGLRLAVRGIAAVEANPALSDYLTSANLRIVRLEESDSLRVRMTRFPELTFAHATLPPALVEWPRDALSLTRAAVILCINGRIAVTSTSTVIERRPGMYLVPPGDAPLTFETLDDLNEVLYISAPASLVSDIDVRRGRSSTRPEVPANVLAPLLAFATSLSAGSVGNSLIVGPLRSVAMEVGRALARLIAEGDPSELTLFSRTMRLIGENHADARLSVPRLAELAGVSPRSLHAAFATEGTTVAGEVRATRAREARELRNRNPSMPAAQIARSVGFGSVSTLYRALEAEARPSASGERPF